MNASKLFTVVIGLQVLSLAGQYLGQPKLVSPAQAQIPDSGAQMAQMIEELKGIRAEVKTLTVTTGMMSTRFDKIGALMDSGGLQVRVGPVDDSKRPAARK